MPPQGLSQLASVWTLCEGVHMIALSGLGKHDCTACGGYVSWEHGGIVCKNCDALFCCSPACVGGEMYKERLMREKDWGQSQDISSCRWCNPL